VRLPTAAAAVGQFCFVSTPALRLPFIVLACRFRYVYYSYVACRAVLRALVSKHIYQWKHHLSDANNEDKIDAKVVNMRKKYKSPETSHNSTETTAA
jgi:hypothetical protein